jgi:hypothetical protein
MSLGSPEPGFSSMKRIALTLFLGLFAASVIGRSVERTVVWASNHAHDFARSAPDRAGARMGEARKHTPWQVQTKSIEDGSLIAASEQSADPPLSETALHHLLTGFIEEPGDCALSSRAPPSLI